MLTAFFLVVTGFGDGTHRTAIDAFATRSVRIKKAISPVVGVGSWCRLN
jgi:hypothetical protein